MISPDDLHDAPACPTPTVIAVAILERAVLRQLRDKGLAVYYAGLWSEDGEPRGAGYAATAAAMKRGATINGNDRKATQ